MRKATLLVLGTLAGLGPALPTAAETVGCTFYGPSGLHLLGSSRVSDGKIWKWEIQEQGQPITIRCDEFGDLRADSGTGVRFASKPGEEDEWRCELRFASILSKGPGEVTVRMRADRRSHFADYEGNWKDVGDLRCTVTKGDLLLEFDGHHHLAPAAAKAVAAAGMRFSVPSEKAGYFWERALPLEGDSAAVVFRAKASGVIDVAFATQKSSSAESYAAVIGQNANSRAVIVKNGGPYEGKASVLKEQDARAGIDFGKWAAYWFSVSRGLVRLGTGEIPGRDVLLEWRDPQPLKDLRWVAFGTYSRLELRAVRLAAVGEGGEGPLAAAPTPASSPPARPPQPRPPVPPAQPPAEVTLPSSLRYLDLVLGQGAPAKMGDDLELAMTTRVPGASQDLDPRTTYRVVLGGGPMEKWFDEGVVGMRPGGKRRLLVPAALHGRGCYGCMVGPNLDLIIEVELLHALRAGRLRGSSESWFESATQKACGMSCQEACDAELFGLSRDAQEHLHRRRLEMRA